MTKIAECERCGRRLVIWAKGYCKSCYDGVRASRELRPEWQRNRSVQPVERIVEQPKEPKPARRADSPAEAFSRRRQVIMRARAALAVA